MAYGTRIRLLAASVLGAMLVVTSASAGILTKVQRLDDGVDGDFGLTMALAVAPDGLHVYTADDDGGVGLFTRNAVDGTLTFVTRYTYPTSDPGGLDCD